MAFLFQVSRQPCDQKIPVVVAAEEAEGGEPGGTVPQNFRDGGISRATSRTEVAVPRGIQRNQGISHSRHPPPSTKKKMRHPRSETSSPPTRMPMAGPTWSPHRSANWRSRGDAPDIRWPECASRRIGNALADPEQKPQAKIMANVVAAPVTAVAPLHRKNPIASTQPT